MPALYLKIRDDCIARKKKKNGGEISEEGIKACKKSAAIVYYRQTGKPVQHSDASEDPTLNDEIELQILSEQLDIFGSLDDYNEWNL